MSAKNALGIIFSNTHDDLVPQLTQKRSIASIPFGSRYRLIDFTLSNLVNAGVPKVGIITKVNYHSLMDHIGSGKAWDLDRKNGGIYILPPYSTAASGYYSGDIDALAGVMSFLERSNEEYVILCDSTLISNIDLSLIIKNHISSGADVTIAYKHGKLPKNKNDIMIMDIEENGRVKDIRVSKTAEGEVDFSLNIAVIKREKLIDIVLDADKKRLRNLAVDVFMPNVDTLKIYGYKVEGFAEVVDSAASYVRISKSLLDRETRNKLFISERPVYTKTKDDMPTRYGINSVTKNSLVADGCVIEGTVKNSILFRGVKIGKGSVVEDCIIMQGTEIGENCSLRNITIDKSAVISDGVTMMGTPENNLFIEKEKRI